MRQLPVAVAAVGILVAACGSNDQSGPASSTSTTSSRPPVAQAALANFLLTPAEIDSTMGVTGTTSKQKIDKLPDDSNKAWPQGWKWPAECLHACDAGEAQVYAGSGYSAVTGDDDVAALPPGASKQQVPPEATQLLVLFPSAKEAQAFFTASSQCWSGCANRQFTTPADGDAPEAVWRVGPVSTASATLSTTVSMTQTNGDTTVSAGCQRALTVRNNVAIDVSACRSDDLGDAGLKIAGQIAGKVDQQ